MDDVPHRPGPPRLLHPTEETIERFYQLGRRGAPHRICAEEFNVSKSTVCNFLNRYPVVKDPYTRGLNEAKAERRAEGRIVRRGVVDGLPPKPAPGEICPTCGGRAGREEDTISISRAELADARRRFENILDREIAARGAAGVEGDE